MDKTRIASWILRILIAVILGQTLFFKFSGAPESVALFSALNMEPAGRYAIGILELIAVVLVLVPSTVPYGALLSLALMSGALFSHATKLGFSREMGSLAALALLVWLASAVLLFLTRRRLPVFRSGVPA